MCLSSRSRNILDDFREAYYWLRQNTDEHARVMSWWDYGYQIAGMANRTTLVDNNTWNNSHIALVRRMIYHQLFILEQLAAENHQKSDRMADLDTFRSVIICEYHEKCGTI